MTVQLLVSIAGVIAIIAILYSNQPIHRKIFEIVCSVVIPIASWAFPNNTIIEIPQETPVATIVIEETPVATVVATPMATEPPTITSAPVYESKEFNTELFLNEYLSAMTSAINNLNFSIVSDFLDEGSSAYAEQKDYIENEIRGNDLREQLMDVEILEENYVDSNTIIVNTRETYGITSNKLGYRRSSFRTEYTIKNISGKWKITYINNITQENLK